MALNPVDDNGMPLAKRDHSTLVPLNDQLREILGPLAVEVETHYEGLIGTASDLLLPVDEGFGPAQWRGIFAREIYRAAANERWLTNRVLAAHFNRNTHVIIWHFDWQLSTDLRGRVDLLEDALMAAIAGGVGNMWAAGGIWRSGHEVAYRRTRVTSIVSVAAYLKEMQQA